MTEHRMKYPRNRLHYAMWTALVIVAGCASRSPLSDAWPEFLVKYGGDTLWALMLFLGLGFLFPRLPTGVVASVVLVYAFGIEFAQLYHGAWMEYFRGTLLGALTVGSGFLWSDFACYTVGCGIGALGEWIGPARVGPAPR